MHEKVNHFPFYRSFKEAIDLMNDEQRLSLYDGITNYAFYGKEYEPMDGATGIAYNLIKPVIATSIKKVIGGKSGGRPSREDDDLKIERARALNKIKQNKDKVKTIG